MTDKTPSLDLNKVRRQHFWGRVSVRGRDDCWEWQGARSEGYGNVCIEQRYFKAHRIAWTICYGEIPSDLSVCHHCDNPPCCNPRHLFTGTHTDNMRDMIRKGKGAPGAGEDNGAAKLSERDVRWIRKAYAAGLGTQEQIGAMFGLAASSIWPIVHRKTWRHV